MRIMDKGGRSYQVQINFNRENRPTIEEEEKQFEEDQEYEEEEVNNIIPQDESISELFKS